MAEQKAVAEKSNDGLVAGAQVPERTPGNGQSGEGVLGLQQLFGNRAVTNMVGGAGSSLLVDDDAAAISPGQMRKTEFLTQLKGKVSATTDEAMAGTGRNSVGCPYLEHWLGIAAGKAAAQVERGIRLFAPEAADAQTVGELLSAVAARVRNGAAQSSGVPETGGIAEGLGGGLAPESAAGVLFKARPGGPTEPGDPIELRRRLGPGQPLDANVRERIEPALGANLSNARLHRDASAAALSDRLNARAFTIGEHVAFGSGEYRPGTAMGDALIAHEMAHVVQQAGANHSATIPATADLEADADRAAAGFLTRDRWGNATREAMPRLRSGLTLSRCKKNIPDQHAGTSLPDATRLAALRHEINPTAVAGAGGVLLPWDGAADALGVVSAPAAAARADLKARLTTAITDYLDAQMPNILATASTPRVPIAKLEGPGRAAKRLVDQRYAAWIDVAALPPTSSRHGFQFRSSAPGKTLFDAFDPADRHTTGLDIDPEDVANWISATATAAVAAKTDHNFNPTDPSRGPERDFLKTEIIDPFVAARHDDLFKFDQFGFAESSPGGIVAPTVGSTTSSPTPGPGGMPSPAERELRWSSWQLLTHEYIHTLEHPTFLHARGNNRILFEGFCEMFTKEVLLDWIPKASSDAQLRQEVEGGSYPPPPAGMISAYDSGDYADNVLHAENIRDTVIGGAGGENAVRAAFFQGHIEYIGLTPAGTAATPVASSAQVTIPAAITTVAALARAVNISAGDILGANPGLTTAGPLPRQLRLPGAREHRVVVAGATPESRAQIAAQNGLEESDLDRANPGTIWTSLTSGQSILIPKH